MDAAPLTSIDIDTASSVPPFEQLRAGVIDGVAAGAIVPGQRLPTVRGLADELGLAPGTVARAYRELETAGVIETRGRSGTFVSLSTDPARAQVERAAAEFARQARALRVGTDDALAIVAAALRAAD